MKRFYLDLMLSVLLLASLFLGGCITSQPSRFYILTPIGTYLNKDKVAIPDSDNNKTTDKSEIAGKSGSGISGKSGIPDKGGISDEINSMQTSKRAALKNINLGLGPVSIAKYLDRSQLVVRLSPHEIKLEDFHQWAGSPRDDIPAILLENMSTVLGIDTIYKYPWKSYADVDFQIIVDIQQLDGRPDESVRLAARWEILVDKGSKSVRSGKTELAEPVSGSGFDFFTAAQSRALGRLSIIIARAVIELL
ncbi:MAG: membrane integrity-associated transporter subunit PqiC [Desulfamplus sp.]|nr:membrane integrity-associated transporter subunit PqiC [Desulfamplus sp.]